MQGSNKTYHRVCSDAEPEGQLSLRVGVAPKGLHAAEILLLGKEEYPKGEVVDRRSAGANFSMQRVSINHPALRAPLLSKAGNPCG